jgi:hypothetical protein
VLTGSGRATLLRSTTRIVERPVISFVRRAPERPNPQVRVEGSVLGETLWWKRIKRQFHHVTASLCLSSEHRAVTALRSLAPLRGCDIIGLFMFQLTDLRLLALRPVIRAKRTKMALP